MKQHQRQQQRLETLQKVIDQHDRVIFDLTLELQKVCARGRVALWETGQLVCVCVLCVCVCAVACR